MTLKYKRVNNVVVRASGTLIAFFKRTIGSQPTAPLASLILVTSKIWRKQKIYLQILRATEYVESRCDNRDTYFPNTLYIHATTVWLWFQG